MAKYKAELDGVSRIRSSGFVLSHAWACKESDGCWHIGGFSTDEEHARQSIVKYCSHNAETRVVPTVEVVDAPAPETC
jgi:hypothetical protein